MPDMTVAAAGGPPAASPPGGAEPVREAKLDDLMLAMDVVDTLRHQDTLVARELGEEQREAQLIERLREIYRGQGLQVTDQILAEGVRALKESRFVYTPAPPSFGRTLATLWVTRDRWLKATAVVLAVAVVGVGAYQYVVVGGAERRAEATRIEFTQTLPAEVDRLAQAITAEAKVQPARDRADRLVAEARQAISGRDEVGARKAIDSLGQLLTNLRQEYNLRIVSRTGEQTGIWRIPPNRPNQRNFYIIVEAVAPDGKLVTLPITSEEDQKTANVSRFGVRVSEATFNAVRRDKDDDGIIQRNTMGAKARGNLEPTWTMQVQGGYITSGWDK